MNKYNLLQKIMDESELMGEPLPGVPVLEIAGDRRVLLEKHCGITEYSLHRVCIKVDFGVVAVCGEELKISQLTKQLVIISGRIEAVNLLRRCR